MKTFRKTFRMEVSIKAETKEQANAIFEEVTFFFYIRIIRYKPKHTT